MTLQQFREGFQSDNDLIFVFETNETSPGCPVSLNICHYVKPEVKITFFQWSCNLANLRLNIRNIQKSLSLKVSNDILESRKY